MKKTLAFHCGVTVGLYMAIIVIAGPAAGPKLPGLLFMATLSTMNLLMLYAGSRNIRDED